MEKLTIEQFTVSCSNREETLQLKSEIFTHHCYYFETEAPSPYIIDAGAHIGLATLYFKKLYPTATVIAIEPHPKNFELLQRNVLENNLTGVTLVNAALASESGYKQLHADTEFEWHSTVSIFPGAWNATQKTEPLLVQAEPLQKFLTRRVDLLKMDIEGAEMEVLQAARKQLPQVKKIICEYHPSSKQQLRLEECLKSFKETGFSYELYQDGKTVEPKQANGLVLIEAEQW